MKKPKQITLSTPRHKLPEGYRWSIASDAGYGKTFYLVCNRTAMSITITEHTPAKLGLRDVAPKVGHNAADHDRVLFEANAKQRDEIKKACAMGRYLVKIDNLAQNTKTETDEKI